MNERLNSTVRIGRHLGGMMLICIFSAAMIACSWGSHSSSPKHPTTNGKVAQQASAPPRKICPECLRYPSDPKATMCNHCKDEALVDDTFGLNLRLNVKNLSAEVNWISLDPADPTVFAVASESNTVVVRSLDPKLPHKVLKVKGWARDVRFAPDGKTLCVASATGDNIQKGLMSTFRLDQTFGYVEGPSQATDDDLTSLAFITNKWFVASAGIGHLVCWNGDAGQSPKHVFTVASPVLCQAKAHKRIDGATIVAEGTSDGSIHLVSLRTSPTPGGGESMPRLGDPRIIELKHKKVNALVFSANDGEISAACDDGSIAIWDLASNKEQHALRTSADAHGKPDAAMSVCYLDDTHLAAGYASGRIVLWDLDHPEAPVILEKAHPGMVLGLDYSGGPGVHRLVSGGGKSIKIWTVLGLGGQ